MDLIQILCVSHLTASTIPLHPSHPLFPKMWQGTETQLLQILDAGVSYLWVSFVGTLRWAIACRGQLDLLIGDSLRGHAGVPVFFWKVDY